MYADNGYNYLLSVKTSDGMVPMLVEPGSKDCRYLGALLRLQATLRP